MISSSARPSGGLIVEASSQVQGAWSSSDSSTSPSEDSSSAQPVPSRRTRSSSPERLPLPEQVAESAPRVITIKRKGAAGRQNAPGSKGEDFVPWASAEYKDFQDLEDEELEERMTGLLDRYAARKKKQRLSSGNESDIAPAQAAGPSQPAVEGGSEVQAIIIPGSPESGPPNQTEPARDARTESKEDDLVLSALQVIPHSDRTEGQLRRSKFMRSGLPRPTLPKQIITNHYAPPRGPEPPRVEVSALGADVVKYIMRRWEPFHRGESAVDRLNNLYPHMLRMPVASRGMGLGKDYSVSVPTRTRKEDIERIIDDGIEVRNRNYVQSTELVR